MVMKGKSKLWKLNVMTKYRCLQVVGTGRSVFKKLLPYIVMCMESPMKYQTRTPFSRLRKN